MIYDLIVVGGGAAGMMAAITAAQSGKKVIIIEKMDRLGKKILATGNGRCNFTNSYYDDSCFRSEQNHFPSLALEQFDHEDAITFFQKIGVAVIEKNGYYYPRSNQASSVADALICMVQYLKIEIVCNCQVDHVVKKSGQFLVSSEKRQFRGFHLLIATGGKAQEKLGSDGSGYILAKQFGHRLVEPFPALTALEIKPHFLKDAFGVRTQCTITALLDGKEVSKEEGELQLTKYGVSGVMVFQLSRYMIDGMKKKKKAELNIDFLPEIQEESDFWKQMAECAYFKSALQWLEGYFPLKLALSLLNKAEISPKKKTEDLSKPEKKRLWKIVKRAPLEVSGWKGFEFAQVTAGGVSVREVSPYTMESEKVPGLFFAGEILDVDGTCGGYNLQWAWTSGYLAGRSIV